MFLLFGIPTEAGTATLTSGSPPRGAPCPRPSRGIPTLTTGTPPPGGQTTATWLTTFAHLTQENFTAKTEGKTIKQFLNMKAIPFFTKTTLSLGIYTIV